MYYHVSVRKQHDSQSKANPDAASASSAQALVILDLADKPDVYGLVDAARKQLK
jgi:hypothetical protein